jgi:hypothetical protein
MLGFDQNSGFYRETPNLTCHEERFFDDDGQPLPATQRMVAFLGESAKNRGLTKRAVDVLVTSNLLEPWSLPFSMPDSAPPMLTNLHRISLLALNNLPGSVLEVLRNSQALDIAYAQLQSIPRLAILRDLYALQAPKSVSPPPPFAANLDSLFSEKSTSEEVLNFDWMDKQKP